MGKYTSQIISDQQKLDLDSDDFMKRMLEIMRRFRTFSDGLDEIMADHGYLGDLSDIDEKCAFLKERFKQAGIPLPRGIRFWYTEGKRPRRKTSFLVCLALGLSAEETDDFFCRVSLERSFDYHSVDELLLYYGIRRGYSYRQIQALEEKIQSTPQSVKNTYSCTSTIYTTSIHRAVDSITSDMELIQYVASNYKQFQHNNVTATKHIQTIWQELAGKKNAVFVKDSTENLTNPQNAHAAEGLAVQEDRLASQFDMTEGKLSAEADRGKLISEYDIYLSILGVDRETVQDATGDRSLKPLLKALHPMIQDCFPDREGITKILRGEHVSYERIRKLLILLLFYNYWAKLAVKSSNYRTQEEDGDRFEASCNQYLLHDGYEPLYAGNPYDWIFLYCDQQDEPLPAFRSILMELAVNT